MRLKQVFLFLCLSMAFNNIWAIDTTGWTCSSEGACGRLVANGVVGPADDLTDSSGYAWVSTINTPVFDKSKLPNNVPSEDVENGATYSSPLFSVSASSFEKDDVTSVPLTFQFNYVTSDGGGFTDFAWARLIDESDSEVALLFTARTHPTEPIVPGLDMPQAEANLPTVSILSESVSPAWLPLGESSGDCYDDGCGSSGWVTASYDIKKPGNYRLEIGVVNWADTAFQSGLAVDGVFVADQDIESLVEDSDGDGLPDIWENAFRNENWAEVPGLRSNHVTQDSKGNAIAEALLEADPNSRNIFLWILEDGSLKKGQKLDDKVLDLVVKAFERNNIHVTPVHFKTTKDNSWGNQIISCSNRDSLEVDSISEEREEECKNRVREGIARIKSTLSYNKSYLFAPSEIAFYPENIGTGRSSALDNIFRFVAWGKTPREYDANGSVVDADYTGIGLGDWNLAYVSGEDFNKDSSNVKKASVLLHELGHVFGLGHGGPWALEPDDISDANQNLKPNHISVMNYIYTFYGLVTNKGGVFGNKATWKVDLQSLNRPSIDEQDLKNFWEHPVLLADGSPDNEYGIKFYCSLVKNNDYEDNFNSMRSKASSNNYGAGKPAYCNKLGWFPSEDEINKQRPNRANLDGNETWGLIETASDWGNIDLKYGGNIGNTKAADIDDQEVSQIFGLHEEPSIDDLKFPQEVDFHLLSPEDQERKANPGQALQLSVGVENLGFLADEYELYVVDMPQAWTIRALPTTVDAIQPGLKRWVSFEVIPPADVDKDRIYKVSVYASSITEPNLEDSLDFEISIVEDADEASPGMSQPKDDEIIDVFGFDMIADAAAGAEVISNEVTLTGFDGPMRLWTSRSKVSVNGGAWTSHEVEVEDGDRIRLQIVASDMPGDGVVAEVRVGGHVAHFVVFTGALPMESAHRLMELEEPHEEGSDVNDLAPRYLEVVDGEWILAPIGDDPLKSRGILSAEEQKSLTPLPEGYEFPYGIVGYTLIGGVAGSEAKVKLTYPETLPENAVLWKYGRTPDNLNPHWYQMRADISDNVLILTLTDGGLGDDDLTPNGVIVDPVGLGVPVGHGEDTVPGEIRPVPDLNQSMLVLLGLLLAGLGWMRMKRCFMK